jgi:hypothetical protein
LGEGGEEEEKECEDAHTPCIAWPGREWYWRC